MRYIVDVHTIYDAEDKSFMGDYLNVEVFVNGKLAWTLGEESDDHSKDRVEGFIKGLIFAVGEENVTVYELSLNEPSIAEEACDCGGECGPVCSEDDEEEDK